MCQLEPVLVAVLWQDIVFQPLLLDWVGGYFEITFGKKGANERLADIDQWCIVCYHTK
jgi:hypothetical protein